MEQQRITGTNGKTYPRPGTVDVAARDAIIRRRRQDGASIRMIANELHCSAGTVHRVIHNSGSKS
jgi:DNA invertase Pin-like site-specific DNA recombinase